MKIIFINFQSGMYMVSGHMQYLTSGWKYIFPHNSRALTNVINFIRKESPDIVSFAEIDGPSWRSKKINQVKVISQKTGLEYFTFFPTRVQGRWINQGNAILSRHPIGHTTQIKLPGYGEKRYLCRADISLGKCVVQYYTTHLSTDKKINIAQRYFIAKKLQHIKIPAILTGDFNIGKDDMQIIKDNTDLNDVVFEPMFPSWQPKMILDHVFMTQEFVVQKSVTYVDEKFSDHLPIGVEYGVL